MSECPTPCDPIVAHQAPLSMEFFRQEYWGGLLFPSPGDLPNPGIEPGSLHCRQTLYHLSHQGSPIQFSSVQSLSRVRLFATSWTVAPQAPRSMGLSRHEYWIGLLFPSPGDLSNPGIKPAPPSLQADSLPSKPPGSPYSAPC